MLDSYKFMSASLDNLVQNLPKEKLTLMDQQFRKYPAETVDLLKKKGSFPYGYVDSFAKLEETSLPPLKMWKNSLDQFNVTTTAEEYAHALKVYNKFGCRNIGDYYKIYLVSDVFLLACTMLSFHEICYETYGVDC